MKHVAARAGVSIATVSHVLNGKTFVSAPLAERVRRAMDELDYQPNVQARNLRRQVTGLIGLLVPDNDNPFYAQVARGVEDTAYSHGYMCILCNSSYERGRELAYLDVLLSHRADGVVFIPVGPDAEPASRLERRDVAAVIADRQVAGSPFDSVRVDNYKGGWLAGQHLTGLGHRRLVCIGHPDESAMPNLRDRTSGFLAALKDSGLEGEVFRGSLGYEGGQLAAREVLGQSDPPTGIFAYDDVTAIGALRGARQRGLQLPRELSVAGFDDIPQAAICEPPLTTVAQQKYELGVLACELLLRRLSGEAPDQRQEVLLEPRLIVRESTARK